MGGASGQSMLPASTLMLTPRADFQQKIDFSGFSFYALVTSGENPPFASTQGW